VVLSGRMKAGSVGAVPIDQIQFTGLIGNQRWEEISVNQFMNKLKENGWDEVPNSHIFQRLKERGPRMGVLTPNDFARALRDGQTLPARDGAQKRVCRGGDIEIIFREDRMITLRDP